MGALDGIRVVDFSRLGPGPYCGMLLADMGADVVRVERLPLARPEEYPYGDTLGRGKRSVGLDLKHPTARDAALRLVDRADVVIEGFRPGVMERLGLGPDVLMDRNPRLVYARVTGWGQDGPLRDRAGHDINYIAVSGALGIIGREGEPPVPPVNLLGDFAGGGMWAALGVLGALVERATSGRGQVVDAAMVDGSAHLTSFLAGGIPTGAWGPRGTNVIDTGAPFYDVYKCADGHWFAVGALEPQFYAELLDGLGLDPESLPPRDDRAGWPELRRRFADAFLTRTRDEWAAVFEGRDACASPVLAAGEAVHHRYNTERGTYVADGAGLRQPLPGPRLSRTPGGLRMRPPTPGEHSREVLAELGLADAEIDRMLTDGAAAGAGR